VTDYKDIGTIIGQMKRAAIDCWMADQDFYPSWGNEDWSYNKWHWAPYQYRRPGADGSGGGTSVGYGDGVSSVAQFDGIRSAIDGVVAQWLGLPDGSLCATPQQSTSATAAILGSSGAGASVQNGGEISTANGTINQTVLLNMKGAFRDPFLMKYYTKFSTAQNGLAQANVILQANYAAESAMWPAVQADVATICDNARKAWAAQAGLASAENTKFQLAVAGAVAGAVASVVTAPTGLTAAVAGLSALAVGINTTMAKVSADAAVEVTGNSYDSILASLKEALNKLNKSISTQEEALNKAMTDASTTIHGNLADYDLDAVVLGSYPVTDGTMQLDKTDANIVSKNMSLVEESLSNAVAKLSHAPATCPTPRNFGVGYSATGTHTAATGLYALTARCLELTTAEYGRGHKLFDATVDDFFAADASAQKTIKDLLSNEALTADLGV
jgi:hypothetical protein